MLMQTPVKDLYTNGAWKWGLKKMHHLIKWMYTGWSTTESPLKVAAFISNGICTRWLKYITILRKKKNSLRVCFKVSRVAVTSQSMVAVHKEEKHNTWLITPDGTRRLEDWHVRVITGDNTAYKPQKLNLKAEKPQTGTEAATSRLQQWRWVSKTSFCEKPSFLIALKFENAAIVKSPSRHISGWTCHAGTRAHHRPSSVWALVKLIWLGD